MRKPTVLDGVVRWAGACSAVAAAIALLGAARAGSPVPGPSPSGGHLTFEERVAAQTAIERVYWAHRIWPKENPGPKPPLEAVMSAEEVRTKVEDYIKKSNALEAFWRRPITAAQLQAEMERMAAHSKQPEVLREIFDALGNDPFVIAECVARPVLADRLIRSWYAKDERIHGDVRRRAERAVEAGVGADDLPRIGATYTETTWRRASADDAGTRFCDGAESLSDEEWILLMKSLDSRVPLGSPPLRLGALVEDDDTLSVSAILERSGTSITVATAAWPKRPLDSWLLGDEELSATRLTVPSATYSIRTPGIDACADDTWQPTLQDVPDPRKDHTAVWTGTEMIVWGGIDHDLRVIDAAGGSYRPATDSWILLNRSGAPSPRRYHTAVWTGTLMVVWGGTNGSTNFDTGGRYDPASDTWTPTSVTVAPASRYWHTAVWTGLEMIVWGGSSDPSFKQGGRYDPIADTWTPTSTTGAPAGRILHTAIWTGSEMIVWGGSSRTNTGGRYNPASDSWTLTSTTGAPVGRERHSAVWTGSEMIVWGGGGAAGQFNSGGRYDPVGDVWTPTPITTDTPSGRQDHTAVWTGTEMIVWGGGDGTVIIKTGARYNPATNAWTPTITVGAPGLLRSRHTAVWTGTEMIVWGGGRPPAVVTRRRPTVGWPRARERSHRPTKTIPRSGPAPRWSFGEGGSPTQRRTRAGATSRRPTVGARRPRQVRRPIVTVTRPSGPEPKWSFGGGTARHPDTRAPAAATTRFRMCGRRRR